MKVVFKKRDSGAKYTVPSIEKAINGVIDIVFYYRLVLVFFSVIVLFLISYHVSSISNTTDRYKNIATVFTCGSIVLGIFYSIINYEYNQRRFRHDVQTAKDHLSFNTALTWQKKEMVEYTDLAGQFYQTNKKKLDQGNVSAFQSELDRIENDKAYSATLSVLNFLESTSIGVVSGILDEEFIKSVFYSLFINYYSKYSVWIDYHRRQKQNVRIWNNFTALSNKWMNS